MSYSKLHSSIVNSSLWTEPDSVRLLFITLLAACDKDGVVYGTKTGLSRLANIDPDDIHTAWHALMSPDKESSDKMRAPEHEGRRIEEVSGGFKLLNFAYYRGLRNEDDRRDQNREAQARFKAKLSQGKPESAKVSQAKPPKAHTETEAEAEAKKTAPSGLPFSSPQFKAAWDKWLQYRKERNLKILTPTGLKTQFAKMTELGEEDVIGRIELAITNNWQGWFFRDAKPTKPSRTSLPASVEEINALEKELTVTRSAIHHEVFHDELKKFNWRSDKTISEIAAHMESKCHEEIL